MFGVDIVMYDNKIEVVLYSESTNFSALMTNNLKDNKSFCIIDVVSSVTELRAYAFSSKDILVVICASKVPIQSIDSIFDILESRGLYAVSVCDNPNINFEMMKRGVLGTVTLKENSNAIEVQSFFRQLELKVLDAFKIKNLMVVRTLKKDVKILSKKIIVIGSSTGGTEAVFNILKKLPAEIPPILIVQHMPPVFTKLYAERLNDSCEMTVWEAKDGELIKPGLALIAPGDYQMRLVKKPEGYAVSCSKEDKYNGHAPSVDVLFHSASNVVDCKNVIGVILTGMGADGAVGLKELRSKGAYTIGQDEASSVVYGMPKSAYDMGAVLVQANIDNIAKIIMENI